MLHEDITKRVLEAAMKVHTALGPGLLESAYQACVHYEFAISGLQFAHQVRLPLVYQGMQLDAGYRIDFLVENCVIVELKAVEKFSRSTSRRSCPTSNSVEGLSGSLSTSTYLTYDKESAES